MYGTLHTLVFWSMKLFSDPPEVGANGRVQCTMFQAVKGGEALKLCNPRKSLE